ncbi:beta-lactamase family protein [Nocardia sp. CDC159]|uniref:Beta-lactamase family protein n=1 Tax=Nocardia pulmonis TaxID=2951408 RepID=A0A9X2IXD1_9NOCA|nr:MULTISPECIES: serine hydrolase domain-containing protein [Nocardia]MCM6772766.1 beta-lactamase family protein [Nocardia pulmonis]MCM6785931.1 beta-lactamase family protein [Nocardia sp. CDC159]
MRLLPIVGALSAVALLTACSADSGRAEIPATSPPPPAAQLRADIDALLRAGATGVIVTVTDQGRDQVFTGGVADRASGRSIPEQPVQQVRVGSITKTFTSALVLQLVGEGRIRLDEPVETYLPGLLRGEGIDGHDITVRQLLRHQSGLPDIDEDERLDEYRMAVENRTVTPAQEVEYATGRPAEFAPGTHTRYSNTNYTVAGILIEKVTGATYSEELDRRILKPLNLRDTYLPATGEHEIRGPHPTGYATVAGTLTDVTRVEPSAPWAAGALVSTGPDLNRFYSRLRAGEVVPPAQLRDMYDSVSLEGAPGLEYGLGIRTKKLPCGTEYSGHTGGIYGYTTLAGTTTQGRAVTVAVTGDTPTLDQLDAFLPHTLCP